MECPHCKAEFHAEFVAKVKRESQIVWKISPNPGEAFCARTVGQTLVDVEKLYISIGKEMGVKTKLMVEKIYTDEDGAISMHLLIVRTGPRAPAKEAGGG